MLNRSWVEVDLGQLKKNYLEYNKRLFSGQEVIAVVKANAYGHGDVQVAKTLERVGVKHFAVANAKEGVRLRKNGIKGSILILSYTPKSSFKLLCAYDLMQTIISEDYAKEIIDAHLPIKVQIAIDSGMNRVGFSAKNPSLCARKIIQYSKKLSVVGIFTHLSCADDDARQDFTLKQIGLFKKVVDKCKCLNLQFVHYANSAGGITYNDKSFNFVRLGVMLYGLYPSEKSCANLNIKPILCWKSVVSMVKTVDKGENVGYGQSYKCSKRSKIATIPTGYADGYSRQLSNNGYVLINGQKANIVGKICMDQFMVDVTKINSVKQGDGVILLNNELKADFLAKSVGTINYEIVCSISNRVERIYKNK